MEVLSVYSSKALMASASRFPDRGERGKEKEKRTPKENGLAWFTKLS